MTENAQELTRLYEEKIEASFPVPDSDEIPLIVKNTWAGIRNINQHYEQGDVHPTVTQVGKEMVRIDMDKVLQDCRLALRTRLIALSQEEKRNYLREMKSK